MNKEKNEFSFVNNLVDVRLFKMFAVGYYESHYVYGAQRTKKIILLYFKLKFISSTHLTLFIDFFFFIHEGEEKELLELTLVL